MSLEDAKTQIDHAFTRADMKGHSFENVFGGATSFMRRRYTKDLAGVDIAVTGVPFDQAVTNRPGTRLGPRAIREASALLPCDPPYGWPFDVLAEFAIADYGDLAFDYAHVPSFPAKLQEHIATLLAADVPTVTLGGDHYLTYPILKAYAAKYGPVSLLQFDAHSDSWPDDDYDRIDHGTFVYKAIRQGIIDPATSVQVGIRTTNNDPLGMTTVHARDVHEGGCGAAVARIKEVLGDRPVYLTFDIDALDPAYAPGTGTPVWGGLTTAQVAVMLRDLAGINIMGGDVVEVSPPFDTTGATAIAGAHVALELLSLIGWRLRGGVR
jgi:agmatinase